MFALAGRGSGDRYEITEKAATGSTIRLLLADRQQELLAVYTDGFRAYEPLDATTHPLVNTSSTAMVDMLMEMFT